MGSGSLDVTFDLITISFDVSNLTVEVYCSVTFTVTDCTQVSSNGVWCVRSPVDVCELSPSGFR